MTVALTLPGSEPRTRPAAARPVTPVTRNRARRVLGAVVLVVGTSAAVAALAGGGAPAASETGASDPDQVHVSAVRHGSTLAPVDASDALLIRAGRTVCSSLAADPSGLARIGGAVADAFGWSPADAAAVVGSAVIAYCPEHALPIGA